PAGSFFAGWDANEISTGVDVLAIHHPAGDLKKSSLGEQTENDEIQIYVGWLSGTTEGGSSGSGLFTLADDAYYLRGGLYAGAASCANSGNLSNPGNYDIYSRLDVVYPSIQQYLAPTSEALSADDQFLWMVPPASSDEQQGFLRLINRNNASVPVTVWGLDADGQRSSGTITLTLAPRESRQFNSQDLESGNTSKGLSGSLGDGEGEWTIVIDSDSDIEALTYIRTPDGFLTAMHDRVDGDGVDWDVHFFNPASNPNQVSRLRLINSTTSSASIQITATDDAGVAGDSTVSLTLPALSSIELTATDLEQGNAGKGLSGSFGSGTGKWRLQVSSTQRLTVQSLLYDPLGKLTNLSTLADQTEVEPDQRVLWLVPPATNEDQQGFIRLINTENRSGTVTLRGVDDAGQLSPGTASFTLAANASQQFNSQDLDNGNTGKGLNGSLGSGSGNWRLLVSTDLDIRTMALIRTPDGFLTTVHELVAGNGLSGEVVMFNPASNPNQVSVLRVINANGSAATVTFQGVDDAGNAAPGGSVSLSLAAGAAVELSASDFESGNTGKGLSGSLGDGEGKWRLQFSADVPVKMMSLLRDPNGYLTNLSTAANGEGNSLEP
ncbi:MAG TPA: hypothetical protein VFY12_05545, partial [Arenimonas sp.]|nr:hypothetical protein [Arenimonas sp.]